MAALGKYAGLPDIDTATDVYETQDVPIVSNAQNDSDSDDSLLRLGSITAKARRKGRQNPADVGTEGSVDGSTLLPNKERSYDPPSGATSPESNSESSDDADANYLTARTTSLRIKETPQARLRRLKWEMAQLEKELEEQVGTSKVGEQIDERTDAVAGDKEGEGRNHQGRTKRAKPSTMDLLKELSGLQRAASNLDQAAVTSSSIMQERIKPVSDTVQTIAHRVQESGVFEEMDADQGDASVPARQDAINDSELGEYSIAAELDRRLHLLEKRIGTGTVDEPILQSLEKLENVLALVAQPHYLDTAARKVKVLLANLGKASALASGPNAAATRRTTGTQQPQQHHHQQQAEGSRRLDVATPDELEKLDALYVLLPRIDPLLPVLPPLLTRLRSLAHLHANASSFQSTLDALESETHEVERTGKDMVQMLKRVEEGLEQNAVGMQKNWTSLEGRLSDVMARLERLDG
ncbi:hypothetical protein QFC19_005350 [Naganishia cerealis]|uniref:Uncharacterized protein n=1 Tax=Naganishia cerealis TaxID=610337 RepID=A0ACC2VPB6_9TREE|nr:hypothetical protein QFC19_005350 [Naganishia cerealis]